MIASFSLCKGHEKTNLPFCMLLVNVSLLKLKQTPLQLCSMYKLTSYLNMGYVYIKIFENIDYA
jgi:hypothetical protein